MYKILIGRWFKLIHSLNKIYNRKIFLADELVLPYCRGQFQLKYGTYNIDRKEV